MIGTPSASYDLGLGGLLGEQRDDQLDEERRKKKLGLSSLANSPLNFGRTGVASLDLGVAGAIGGR